MLPALLCCLPRRCLSVHYTDAYSAERPNSTLLLPQTSTQPDLAAYTIYHRAYPPVYADTGHRPAWDPWGAFPSCSAGCGTVRELCPHANAGARRVCLQQRHLGVSHAGADSAHFQRLRMCKRSTWAIYVCAVCPRIIFLKAGSLLNAVRAIATVAMLLPRWRTAGASTN